jgi:hypothetical protein
MSDFLFILVDLGKQVVHFVCNFFSAGQAPNYRALAGCGGIRLARNFRAGSEGFRRESAVSALPTWIKVAFPSPSDVLEKASECVDNSIKFWRARYG